MHLQMFHAHTLCDGRGYINKNVTNLLKIATMHVLKDHWVRGSHHRNVCPVLSAVTAIKKFDH